MGIIGIDEVGRGCWAGPLVVVAVRQVGVLPPKLKDSKLLSRRQRELFYYDIQLTCDVGEGWVDAEEVDKLGLTEAMRVGVKRALTAIKAESQDVIVIDGHINYCPKRFTNVQCVIKADSIHPIVSAASVYAKVRRDSFMYKIAKKYPEYHFEKHVGYGTKQHKEALATFGPTPLHRVSFRPIQNFL